MSREKELLVEERYLGETLGIIERKLKNEFGNVELKKERLITAKKEMYENTAHDATDFGQVTEIVQHLTDLRIQSYDYEATEKRVFKLQKLFNSPYFARVDFTEEGYEQESIYIGISNLTDEENYDIYVYDWRVPIASIFYRYELGEASYHAPSGTIKGNVTLKRQFGIKEGKLEYFFDSRVNVVDDILKKILSNNTSAKMKTIVESIQREQDIIIRDMENDLVMVQGVAGSGKTSVALHRVAFLLYQGLTEKLNKNNIIMISPNHLFAKYIANVLPELGEENITTLTFEDIFSVVFGNKHKIMNRNFFLEELMTTENPSKRNLLKQSLEFKLSKNFVAILEKFIRYYEHKLIDFTDVYFHGQCIANRHLLKMTLLNKQKRHIPVQKRLEQIETKLNNTIKELSKERLDVIEKFIYENTNHPFDSRTFARLILRKQKGALKRNIEKFTRINYFELYKKLFQDKNLFNNLSKEIELPSNIDEIIELTQENLSSNNLFYEDAMALICLKIKMTGENLGSEIKQLVVDEAQDYYPLHYEILKLLFNNSKYTIVGDINQTVEKKGDISIYNDIKTILNKPRSITVSMNKSFRCSYEINNFASKFLETRIMIESFDRHGNEPEIIRADNIYDLDDAIIRDVRENQQFGYSSIAILCKTMKEARLLYGRLKSKIDIVLINEKTADTAKGTIIVPIYMAKGLEFDAVLVYGTDAVNYNTTDDKNLLYIACTRALHSLSLYHTGEVSGYLK